MRQLTQNEIVNKPHWAKSYSIHAQNDTPIFYAGDGGGAMPIPSSEELNQEIAELKAIVDEFIEEFSCFVAQHECNCGHPSCRTCKECRDAFKVLDNAVKLREGKS